MSSSGVIQRITTTTTNIQQKAIADNLKNIKPNEQKTSFMFFCANFWMTHEWLIFSSKLQMRHSGYGMGELVPEKH